MQSRKQTDRSQRIETAAQRFKKIRELTSRATALIAPWDESATPDLRKILFAMLDDFDDALIRYRNFEEPWDSQLIDVIQKIGDISCIVKTISTFDTPMDKVREIYAFVALNDNHGANS